MSFGRVLFSGSRFLSWTLVPLLLLFALFMPFTFERPTRAQDVLLVAIEIAALLLALALAKPDRFRWAGRIVAGEVFVACAVYAGLGLLHRNRSWFGLPPVHVSPVEAVVGSS